MSALFGANLNESNCNNDIRNQLLMLVDISSVGGSRKATSSDSRTAKPKLAVSDFILNLVIGHKIRQVFNIKNK